MQASDWLSQQTCNRLVTNIELAKEKQEGMFDSKQVDESDYIKFICVARFNMLNTFQYVRVTGTNMATIVDVRVKAYSMDQLILVFIIRPYI